MTKDILAIILVIGLILFGAFGPYIFHWFPRHAGAYIVGLAIGYLIWGMK